VGAKLIAFAKIMRNQSTARHSAPGKAYLFSHIDGVDEHTASIDIVGQKTVLEQ